MCYKLIIAISLKFSLPDLLKSWKRLVIILIGALTSKFLSLLKQLLRFLRHIFWSLRSQGLMCLLLCGCCLHNPRFMQVDLERRERLDKNQTIALPLTPSFGAATNSFLAVVFTQSYVGQRRGRAFVTNIATIFGVKNLRD